MHFPFSALCGQREARLGLLLAALNPAVKGVLLVGEKGVGKSTAARALAGLLKGPFVNLPLSVTTEALLGSVDVEALFREGQKFTSGLLTQAHGGVLYLDEINLFSPYLLSFLLDVAESGRLKIEREGYSSTKKARFLLIGSMNPEEGPLSPQILDRFGLCVEMRAERDLSIRVEIIKRCLAYEEAPDSFFQLHASQERALQSRLEEARQRLSKVKVPLKIKEAIVAACQAAKVAGHRGDIVFLEAAKAHAAWEGRCKVLLEDLEAVSEMVLRHRRREAPKRRPKAKKAKIKKQTYQIKNQIIKEKHLVSRLTNVENGIKSLETPKKDLWPFETEWGGVGPSFDDQKRLFPVGEVFRIRDDFLGSNRIKKAALHGRRDKALTLTGPGYFLRAVPYQGQGELALYPTLVAALLNRPNRKGEGEFLKKEDLRAKLKVTKSSRLLIFCVDGSGSMAAEARMKETKGAIMSLLLSAYQKRDQVALMVFRGQGARFVLPPTSSVEFAGKILRHLTVGGSTPLALALERLGVFLSVRERRFPRENKTVFLITDGRGNVSLRGRPVREEIQGLALSLRSQYPQVQFIVVDTETGPVRLGLAKELAFFLGAHYFTPDVLRADRLLEIARSFK